MARHGPRMTQNDPKRPKNGPQLPQMAKNDARIYALFPQILLSEKAVPQTFSLLECMRITSTTHGHGGHVHVADLILAQFDLVVIGYTIK